MEIVNNRYQLSGGVDPLELAAQYGTPLYVYDSAIMKKSMMTFVRLLMWLI